MKRPLRLTPLAAVVGLRLGTRLRISAFAADAYEPDDTMATAAPITADGTPQAHEITVGSTVDVVKFGATAGCIYKVKVAGVASLRLSSVTASLGDGTPLSSDLRLALPPADTPFYVVADSSQPIYVRVAPEAARDVSIAVWEFSGRPIPGLTDRFEPDNIAADASAITTDGAPQVHAVEGQLGIDWIRFAVAKGMYYALSFFQVTGYPYASVGVCDSNGNDLMAGSSFTQPGTRYWLATYDGYAYAKVWGHLGGLTATYGFAVQEHAPAAIVGERPRGGR